MYKYTRIILYFAIAVIVLLALFIITVNKLLNSDSIRKDLIGKLKEETGAEFAYKKMDLSIFPRINVVISNVTYDLENNKNYYSGMLDSVSIYPKITPLFRKKIEIAEVKLYSPKLNYEIDLNAAVRGLSGEHMSIIKLFSNKIRELAEFSTRFKGFKFNINNGQLNLVTANKETLSFRSINLGIISINTLTKLKISCNSDFFRSLNGSLFIDTDKLIGQMKVEFAAASPHLLSKFYQTDSKYILKDSMLDLNMDINQFALGASGNKFINGVLSGNFERLNISNSNSSIIIEGKNFDGSVNINENNTRFIIRNLNLIKPAINLNGEIHINNNPKSVSLIFGGNEFNVDPVRNLSSSFLGKSGLAGKIFDVVRGGHINWIKVKSRALTYAKLFKDGNYEIKGKMNKGEIYIPSLNWTFNNVYGDANISKDILEGVNVGGKHKGNLASDGRLKIGLTKKKDILEIDTAFKGDLETVPFYMNQFVKNEKLLNEISTISNINGTAEGRLSLGEKKSSVDFKIDISDVNLRANYPRIPYPININTGNFLYEQSRVEIRNMSGNIAKSNFEGVSLNYEWSNDKMLEIPKLNAMLSLDQFYPWISSFDRLSKYFRRTKLVDGILDISSLYFEGNPFNSSQWQYRILGSGNLRNKNTLKFSYDVQKKDDEIKIKKLSLHDKYSDLNFGIDYENKLKGFEFAGNLSGSTLSNLVENSNFFDGYINGDVRVYIDNDQLATDGELEGQYMHCGMYVVVNLRGADELSNIDLNIKNEGRELADTIECIINRPSPITGKYEFSLHINSDGKAKSLKDIMQGTYSFKSRDGTIMREEELFFKIFSILNISTLFKGKLGTINDKNLTYTEINSSGNIEDGKFIIKNGELYGPSTGLLANGYIDPLDKHMDIHLKATPLESIDWFLRIIPFLDKIQTKKFIYIPVHIVGWFDNNQFNIVNHDQ